MKKKILITILLFIVGGILQDTANYKTLGSLIVIGTFIWSLVFIFVMPISKFIRKIFNRKKEVLTNPSQTSNSGSENTRDITTPKPSTETKQVEAQIGRTDMDYLTPRHKLLLISISRSLKEGADIYNAVRYAWKLNVDRARSVDFVLAHQSGKVIGVFVADKWLPANDPAFSEFQPNASSERWGFVGRIAPSEILLLYFGKNLPDDLRKKGASNPIRFLDNSSIEGSISNDAVKNTDSAKKIDQTSTSLKKSTMLTEVVASVDSDGDFSANATLQTGQFGHEGEQLFVKSQIWVSRDGERLIENCESEDEVLAGQNLTISTGFEKISFDDGAQFTFHADVNVYTVDETKIAILDQSSKNVTIELKDITVRVDAIEIDDDGDHYVKYTVLSEVPSVLAVRIGLEKDKELDGFFRQIDETEEFQEYVMNVSDGDRIKIQIITMCLSEAHIPLQGIGTVTVIAPEETENEHVSDEENDSDEATVFYYCLDASDIIHDDDLTDEEKANALSTRAIQLVESIRNNVDVNARFFSVSNNEGRYKMDMENDKQINFSVSVLDRIFETESLEYFAIVRGNAHWRKNFLRVSEDLPSTLYVCGLNEDSGAVVVQGYCDGDFDTGIICTEELDLYSGDTVLERFSISESDFQLSAYAEAD